MSYLGNNPSQQAFAPAVDYFNGNASTVAFTLSRPVASVAQVQVTIENVPQNPSSSFTVSGSTITFTSAPPSGTSNIYVQYTSPITQVVALPQDPQVFGNLQFSSVGARITGDMSNGTTANRLAFQTSTANSTTSFALIPNGTGTNSNITWYGGTGGSDITNASSLFIGISNGETTVRSGLTGTGTYLPMTFYTGGSERARIDTSGNVGIGGTPNYKLNILSADAVGTTNTIAGSQFALEETSRSHGIYMRTTGGTGAGVSGQLFTNQIFGFGGNATELNSSSITVFGISGTERMRINSSGYVGINNTSPSRRLVVTSGAATKLGGANGALFTDSANDGGILIGSDFTFANIQGCNAAGTSAKNLTINPEGGECYVGGASDNGAYNLQCIGTGVWGAGAYVNGSDERIKEDITPIESSLDVVKKLNPVTYRYKESWSKDQSIQTGFIAQELLVALEGKNYVNGIVQQGGSEGYYSVAYQNIIPILTAAIQEQQALIVQLQADVAALKGIK